VGLTFSNFNYCCGCGLRIGHWYSEGNGPKAAYGDLNKVDFVDKFRVGEYGKAEEKVKQAWTFCMLQCMPSLNGSWKHITVRQTQPLSNIVSSALEAYLLWVISYQMPFWVKEMEEDAAWHFSHPNEKPPKKTKRKHRPTLSIDKLAEYEALRQEVVACRKNKEDSASWDIAIMQEVNKCRNEEAIKRKAATSAVGQPTPTVVPR